MIRKLTVIGMLFAFMGFAMGCGNDPVKDYKTKIRKEVDEFGSKLAPLAGSPSETSTLALDTTTMKSVAEELRDLADDIDELKVPKDSYKSPQAQLVKQINDYASVVDNSAGQDPAAFANQAQLFTTNICRSLVDIDNTSAALCNPTTTTTSLQG